MRTVMALALPVVIGVAGGIILLGMIGEGTEPEAGLTAGSLAAGGSPVLGDSGAPVTILEWGDYQCTYCVRFHDTTLKMLDAEYIQAGTANLVFKDFPLNGPDSVMAAEASHCAGDQGAYWRYHDILYERWSGERTGWITREALAAFAEELGLDAAQFERCMDGGAHAGRVAAMHDFGREIGIDATPSFLIFDDRQVIKIRGNQPPDVFQRSIDQLLRADQG